MKAWMWSALVFAVVFALITFTSIPWWAMMAVGVPVLLVLLVYVSVVYSFRPGLAPADIPARGYEGRLRDLEAAAAQVEHLDFARTDAFYLRTIPDSVTYVFRHRFLPIYLCAYHLGSKQTCDLISAFEGEITLTSCPSVESGMLPRAPGSLLQVVPAAGYQDLFHAHMEAHIFLREKGAVEKDIPAGQFRARFMKAMRESLAAVRKRPLWPVRMIYWTLTKRGRMYQRPIREQWDLGMIAVLGGQKVRA